MVDGARDAALVDAAAHGGVALRIEIHQQHAPARLREAAARLTLVVVLPTPPFWFDYREDARHQARPGRAPDGAAASSSGTLQARPSSSQSCGSSQLVVRMRALHRGQHAAGRDADGGMRRRNPASSAKAARDHERRSAALRAPGLDASVVHLDVAQARARSPPGAGTRPSSGSRRCSVTRHSGRAMASGMPGRPAARADVGESRRRASGRCGSTASESSRWWLTICKRIADRGQVVGAVPFREQLQVVEQLVARAAGKREREFAQARDPARPRRHAVFLSRAVGSPVSDAPAAAKSPPASRPRCAPPGRWFRADGGSASAALRSTARAPRVVEVRAAARASLRSARRATSSLLALDVALVLGLDLDLLGDRGSSATVRSWQRQRR